MPCLAEQFLSHLLFFLFFSHLPRGLAQDLGHSWQGLFKRYPHIISILSLVQWLVWKLRCSFASSYFDLGPCCGHKGRSCPAHSILPLAKAFWQPGTGWKEGPALTENNPAGEDFQRAALAHLAMRARGTCNRGLALTSSFGTSSQFSLNQWWNHTLSFLPKVEFFLHCSASCRHVCSRGRSWVCICFFWQKT